MNHKLSSPVLARPTRVRYLVLAFACALSMITYLDRVCVSSATRQINAALGLSDDPANLDWAFTAFAFAYAVFEIPSGWLGDLFGPRNVLIRIVLWWSFFTAMTGLIGLPIGPITLGFGSVVIIRFLFGMGEAGAYPNITRALHNWFPFRQRGLAQGAVWMSGRLMGGLSPLLWLVLVEGVGTVDSSGEVSATEPLLNWRATFWVFGLIGVVWCVLFALWFRNRPEEKSTVNEAERDLIQAGREGEQGSHLRVPWMKLLKNGNLWMLCLMYFCGSYGWYFNITYLPKYLEEQQNVSPQSLLGAVYKGGPLWMGAMACLAGGWLTDWFIRRTGNRVWGRRLFGVAGHGLCALCYLATIAAHNAQSLFFFFLGISLAAFFNDLTMGAAWATCQDIGKRYAAIVAGCMNTIGNLGGAVAGKTTGMLVRHSVEVYKQANDITADTLSKADLKFAHQAGYGWCLLSFAVVYVIAVVFWLRIDASRPVAQEVDEFRGSVS
jgi:MFS family permease